MKQFWIPLTTLIINSDKDRPDGTHVIDYNSYQQLLEEAKKMREYLDRLCPEDCGCERRKCIASFDRFLESTKER